MTAWFHDDPILGVRDVAATMERHASGDRDYLTQTIWTAHGTAKLTRAVPWRLVASMAIAAIVDP